MTVSMPEEPNKQNQLASSLSALKQQAMILTAFVVLFWGLEIFDWFLNGRLDQFGVRPRTIDGLQHIFYAPFLHGGFGHLATNTVPFIALGFFVLLRGYRHFFWTTFLATVVGGLGIWLIGKGGTVHLGASILIFGYLGFLMVLALLERSLQAMSLALVAIFLYGSLIWGVLPIFAAVSVSWEGHLFGFLGGVLSAWLLADRKSITL